MIYFKSPVDGVHIYTNHLWTALTTQIIDTIILT